MKITLTKPVIDKALLAHQRCSIWDAQVTGLYVEVRENGKASYFLRYAHASQGKQTVNIGPAHIIKLDEARVKARELLSRVYLGDDPAQHRDDLRASLTLDELVSKHYLPHAKVRKKSWKTDEGILRLHILPVLGTLKINAITAGQIASLQLGMREKGLAPASCNRGLNILKTMFNLAIKQWQLPGLKDNPVRAVQFFKIHHQPQTFLEPGQLELLLQETRDANQNPQLPYIIALMSLTGVRKSNAMNARWVEVDEANGTWTIPETKSGRPQTIQLSDTLVELLQALPSRGQSEYLFPNPRTGKPFTDIFYAWDHARKKVGLGHVRLHDLRHTFASLLINAGHSLYVVQKALGHQSPAMTTRYAHLADATLKQANNAVGGLIKTGIQAIIKPR
ncbi:MAG: tyrosine-type recombinase/integrase [Pseudomonadota bacterium]